VVNNVRSIRDDHGSRGNLSFRTDLMETDELVLGLSVAPEPDGSVVTRRHEDVSGQLLIKKGLSWII